MNKNFDISCFRLGDLVLKHAISLTDVDYASGCTSTW